jgi:hypothetical protein
MSTQTITIDVSNYSDSELSAILIEARLRRVDTGKALFELALEQIRTKKDSIEHFRGPLNSNIDRILARARSSR